MPARVYYYLFRHTVHLLCIGQRYGVHCTHALFLGLGGWKSRLSIPILPPLYAMSFDACLYIKFINLKKQQRKYAYDHLDFDSP